jgi:putative lipoprotein
MYWRITQLSGNRVTPPEASRKEPQLILRDVDGKRTYSATVGCNSMSGSYSVSGGAITFEPGISTLMACSSPLDTMELQLRTAISGTRRWRIAGNTLELRDEDGRQLALFEAVPLR